jgi:hypothetical protein
MEWYDGLLNPMALPAKVRPFRGIVVVLACGALLWFGWARIAGTPAWLRQLGFLRWLDDLSPLDRWLGVIANFLVAVVALFQERIRGWFTRARLELEYASEPPFCCTVPVIMQPSLEQFDAHHIRMRIRNTGSSPAEHVEVYAAALYDSERRRIPWFLPMNLTWADEPQPQGYPPLGFKARLLPETGRMCNLLNVVKADLYPLNKIAHRPRDFTSGPAAKLYTVTDPTSYSNLLFPGTYFLDVEMSAQNVRLTTHHFKIRLTAWYEDSESMFSENGISVELLKPSA